MPQEKESNDANKSFDQNEDVDMFDHLEYKWKEIEEIEGWRGAMDAKPINDNTKIIRSSQQNAMDREDHNKCWKCDECKSTNNVRLTIKNGNKCWCGNTCYFPDETTTFQSAKWTNHKDYLINIGRYKRTKVWICMKCTSKNTNMESSHCQACQKPKSQTAPTQTIIEPTNSETDSEQEEKHESHDQNIPIIQAPQIDENASNSQPPPVQAFVPIRGQSTSVHNSRYDPLANPPITVKFYTTENAFSIPGAKHAFIVIESPNGRMLKCEVVMGGMLFPFFKISIEITYTTRVDIEARMYRMGNIKPSWRHYNFFQIRNRIENHAMHWNGRIYHLTNQNCQHYAVSIFQILTGITVPLPNEDLLRSVRITCNSLLLLLV